MKKCIYCENKNIGGVGLVRGFGWGRGSVGSKVWDRGDVGVRM